MTSGRPMALPPPPVGACDYCGLPLAGSGASREDVAPEFCCFGCRFAAEVTQARGETAHQRWMALTLGLAIFGTMNVVMLTMALWSYAAADSPFERSLADFLRYGALLFATPVLLVLGRPLAESAWEQLRRGVWSTDLLLLTGVVTAYLVSVWATVRSDGHVYYEVSCVILVLVTVGRWLEATGRLKASAALDQLERLLPDTVRVVDTDGDEVLRPRRDVLVGQRLRVLAGERIPVDGTIVRGRGVVDEQFFTGESTPAEKEPGSRVLGGSLNLDGELVLTTTSPPDAGALGRLVQALHEARRHKGPFQILADRWSRRFFPIISVVAAGTFAFHTWRADWETGLLTALSVVLISCPCALALATPLVIWSALARGAAHGVLFRSGAALERLAGIRAIRWDKTGTLTAGRPQVRGLLLEDDAQRDQVEAAAAMLTRTSQHPFSLAIRDFLDPDTDVTTCDEVRQIAGRGLEGRTAAGETVRLGAVRWLEAEGATLGPRLAARLSLQGNTTKSLVALGWNQELRAVFVLDEALRPEVPAVLADALRRGLDLAVLTGDRAARGLALSATLGLPVRAELLPEDKLAALREVQAEIGPVAMVGDGLNDAPALSAAEVGIALGCGADVTRDSADVCLLTNDLRRLPWALDLAEETVRRIRGNLRWSFGYNGLGVVVAACGWLHPALAAALMVISSLMVLQNSLSLATTDETDTTDASAALTLEGPLQRTPAEVSR